MSHTTRSTPGFATPPDAFGAASEAGAPGPLALLLSQVPYALLTLAVLALAWLC